jgi:hypothetical protein
MSKNIHRHWAVGGVLVFVGSLLAASASDAAQKTQPAKPAGKASIPKFGSAPDGSTVIFDFGPSTGTVGGCWANTTESQNFAEQVNFPLGALVDSIAIYTCIPPTGGTVHLKILADDGAGNPAAVVYSEDKVPDSWVADPTTGGFVVVVNLTAQFNHAPATTLWYGLSGNAFELGQFSVLTPGNGTMAQFSGPAFQFHTTVGDQMFQLSGTILPVELQSFDVE